MVKNELKKICFLAGLAAMTVLCFGLWELLNSPMTVWAAEPVETPEPEIVYVEKTVTETVTQYVNVPQLVTVEVPVVVEKQITVDRPIIAQESSERWQGIDITPEHIERLARLARRLTKTVQANHEKYQDIPRPAHCRRKRDLARVYAREDRGRPDKRLPPQGGWR